MNDSPTTRIVIVDEHLLFREGLKRMLEDEPGFAVVGNASEPAEAVRTTQEWKPDLLIAGLSGRPLVRMMQMLRGLPANGHMVRTLVLTTTAEAARMLEVLQLGAAGIVLRESSSQDLLKSIRRLLADHAWIERQRASGVLEAPRHEPAVLGPMRDERPFGLTPREQDIVGRVARGESNKTIAERFSIAEVTVKHHLTRIYDKTGVVTRLELAVFAINHELA
jgi:two-component system, NarL family, nitrate/nitrite response regulator NarL